MSELSDAATAVLHSAEAQLAVSAIESVSRTPASVTTLLNAGEDVVAFETLCENLYEGDIAVARELLSQLRDAAQRAGADVALINVMLS